ncbi:hypothetical protein VP01_3818g4 [Puccinia sorghi]|uniref:Uncharacterized protein n=1 Tax=Puccinia sorghi TaxID=27349 RepID=A0A0L6UU45_9BASI|nr:hypothetical protein VP01_3818g4 [Puccinia sorghi]
MEKSLVIANVADVPAEFLVFIGKLSHQGTAAAQYLCDSNVPCFTLIPGISYHSVLAMTVAKINFKPCDSEIFLTWKLSLKLTHTQKSTLSYALQSSWILTDLSPPPPPPCPELNPIDFCFSR